MLRRLFQALFVLGSLAGMASCGATDEGAQAPNRSLSQSSAGNGDEDGGVTEDGGIAGDGGAPDSGTVEARVRTLLVQGGDVTFIGVERSPRHCRAGDGGAGCSGQPRFSGAVVIRGATFSILRPNEDDGGVPPPPGDDGGVGAEDGGTTGNPIEDGGFGGSADGGISSSPRNALVRVDEAALFVSLPGDDDGGVGVSPNQDGGSSGGSGTVELLGGRILVVLGRPTGPDGGVGGATGRGDGHLDVRELHHIGAVIIQGSTVHFRGGEDADGGPR